MLPLLLYLFEHSLSNEAGFSEVLGVLALWPLKLLALGLIWAYMHHFCAGIRFLLLDMHIGDEMPAALYSALIAFAVSITLTLLIGWRVLL